MTNQSDNQDEDNCKHNWLKPQGRRTICTLCGRDGWLNLDVDAEQLHTCHEDCQRPACVLRRERDDFEYRLACLLCHATDGLWSKSNYTKDAMYSMVDERIEREINEATDQLTQQLQIAREALKSICGNRCAHQNPCEAREALEKIDQLNR